MRITEDPRRIPILKTKSKMTRGKSKIMKKRTHQETPVNLNNKGNGSGETLTTKETSKIQKLQDENTQAGKKERKPRTRKS